MILWLSFSLSLSANLFWINQDTTVDVAAVQALLTQAVSALSERGNAGSLVPNTLLPGRDATLTRVLAEEFV
jgi:hypothetical protein